MTDILTVQNLISLLTLTLLEIVLGIDNIIFISIIAAKLPHAIQDKARKVGLFVALFVRIGLLFGISWVIGLKSDLITVFGMGYSGRDLILLAGGLFLIAKTTSEIHDKLEGEKEEDTSSSKKVGSFTKVIVQIVLIDIVFSFDSILTAVGLVKDVGIMIAAVIISMMVMFFFSRIISDFVNNHPTIKMLALSFLIMIGFLLVVEAFDVHVEKGYVYFAMAFALIVELLNMRLRKKTKPVQLRQSLYLEDETEENNNQKKQL